MTTYSALASLRRTLSAAVAVAALDLTTKLAAGHMPVGRRSGPFLSLPNPDFTLGVASAPRLDMLVLMAAGVVLGAIVAVRRVRRHGAPPWAAGLLIGGAVANLADRTLHGAVQDFIVLGPVVVNVADLAILAGLLAVLAHRHPQSMSTP